MTNIKEDDIISAMFTDRSRQQVKYLLKDGTQHIANFEPSNPLAKEILKVVPISGLEKNFLDWERREDRFRKVAETFEGREDKLLKTEIILKLFDEIDGDGALILQRILESWNDYKLNYGRSFNEYVENVENINIFLNNKTKILYLIDNWNFVDNQLSESGKSIETEIIEKVVEKEVAAPLNLETFLNFHNNKEQFFKLKLEIFERPEVKDTKDREWKSKMRKSKTIPELLAAWSEGPEVKKNESNESLD